MFAASQGGTQFTLFVRVAGSRCIDVPTLNFTLHINVIKELPVTLSSCFHLCSEQLAMLHFHSTLADTLPCFRLMKPSVMYLVCGTRYMPDKHMVLHFQCVYILFSAHSKRHTGIRGTGATCRVNFGRDTCLKV